ncbi:MAG: HtaA domain-containing protein, partial [Propionicimonas sp.]|nr:HtaA domain-containing protein [Propionicimonas sp.]
MAASTLRRARTASRGRRAGAMALALALGTATALGAAVAPAAAAEVEVESGSLAWGVKQSLRSYVGTQLAALAQPLSGLGGGGAAPVGTRIVPFDGASFDSASASASASNAAETKAYLFPASAADVTDADNLTIAFDGGVQYWFPSHGFDIKFGDLSLVIDDGTATIVGDIAFSDVAWDGVAQGSGWTLGTPNVGDDIVIATVDDVAVTLGGGEVAVTATGVAFTAAAGDVFCNPVVGCLYPAGTAIDDFSVAVSYATGGGEEPEPVPTVTLSRSTGLNPEADSITVTGTGFDTSALGTRPPLAGKTGGVYVALGAFADAWRPSAGAASATRKLVTVAQGGQKWAVLEGDVAAIGGANAGAVVLDANGSFTATLAVSKAVID